MTSCILSFVAQAWVYKTSKSFKRSVCKLHCYCVDHIWFKALTLNTYLSYLPHTTPLLHVFWIFCISEVNTYQRESGRNGYQQDINSCTKPLLTVHFQYTLISNRCLGHGWYLVVILYNYHQDGILLITSFMEKITSYLKVKDIKERLG